MSRFLPLALLLLPFQVFATAPVITGVSGASAYISTGTPTIMGGLSGSACTNSDTTQTCSSCDATHIAADTACTTAPLCACNPTRIYDGLQVRLTLQPNGTSSSGSTGTMEAWAQYSLSGGTKTPLGKLTSGNGGAFIDFNWTTICAAIGATSTTGTTSANCEGLTSTLGTGLEVDIWIDTTGGNTTAPGAGQDLLVTYFKAIKPSDTDYNIYGNPNSEGIDAFTPYPGDGQVYLTNLSSSSGFPTMTYGIQATNVIVFPSPNSMNDANYSAPPVSPTSLALNDTGATLANNVVSGLQNDQLYFFRIAVSDQANNVVQYFPDSTGLDPSCTTSPSTACPYSATPSQVLGLLTKDMNCFVATAAYGSNLEPKLDTFRRFRRRFLLTNSTGRAFVDWYYRFGPRAAQFIHDKPWIRGAVRAGLWPLYGFSAFALRYGILPAGSLALLLMSSLALLFWFMGRRTFARV